MKSKPVSPILTPPLIALVLVIISFILHLKFPIATIVSYPYNLLGIIGILLGFKISFQGKNVFKRLGVLLRPGSKSDRLVVDGPFRYTRNPMYLGFVIMLVGISFILGSVSAFLAPVVFFLVIHFTFIPFEEKLMKKQFGKEYLEYKNRVRKWV